MKPKFTHTGIVRGCDARTPDGYVNSVRLRETATMWIEPNGTMWRKSDGRRVPREPWSMYRLELSTVKETPDANADD